MKNAPRLSALVLTCSFLACGGDSDSASSAGDGEPTVAPSPSEASAAPPVASVSILAPAAGAELTGTSVTVRLSATGIEISPAGQIVPGTGHHHIYLDEDLGSPGAPVASIPGSIIHLGDGSSEYTFEDVAPGEHRLITIVADGIHIPLEPRVADTVRFTIR